MLCQVLRRSFSGNTTFSAAFSAASKKPSFHVVSEEYGFSGRPLPTWACSHPNNIQFDDDDQLLTECRDLSEFVPGCFQLLNVLSNKECDQIISHLHSMNWDEDAPVSLPHSFRHMENVNWLVDDAVVGRIWKRVAGSDDDDSDDSCCLPHFAKSVAENSNASGINARFRCYRYQVGDYFKPHTDGSWPGSGLSDDRKEMIWDKYPGKLWSQYTFLLLLTDNYNGGRTIFYPEGMMEEGMKMRTEEEVTKFKDVVDVNGEAVAVRTPRGAALCFPHGGHPDHAKHAGEMVEQVLNGTSSSSSSSSSSAGQKIMIRTEILYERTSESDQLQKDWFRSGSGAVPSANK